MTDRITSETELIETYLLPLTRGQPGALALKDDAAFLEPPEGRDLVLTSDPVVAGVHFFASDAPRDIAWKALAVNLSDLAAKGATPLTYILTLAFPDAPQRAWMREFADGLRAAQESFGLYLSGGDTDHTGGPLSIGVTAIGSVPKGKFVPRQGARPGDVVFVSGTLGDAALGLAVRREASVLPGTLTDDDRRHVLTRYLRPQPRLALAPLLCGVARAALDVSDGLVKDLRRLAGGYGCTVRLDALPLSAAMRRALAAEPRLADAIVSGGDDYEILLAAPPERATALATAAAAAGVPLTRIGLIEEAPGVRVLDAGGAAVPIRSAGYDHFAQPR